MCSAAAAAAAATVAATAAAAPPCPRRCTSHTGARRFHSSTSQLNVSTNCGVRRVISVFNDQFMSQVDEWSPMT